MCNVIEPIFDRSLIYDSYACRKDKGSHKAVERFTEFSRKNEYVLKCDVKAYFASIDHEILYRLILKKTKDPGALYADSYSLGRRLLTELDFQTEGIIPQVYRSVRNENRNNNNPDNRNNNNLAFRVAECLDAPEPASSRRCGECEIKPKVYSCSSCVRLRRTSEDELKTARLW